MTQSFADIFKLEDSKRFDEAFDAYNNLCNERRNDYEVWKYFYFFLWVAIEDAPASFHDKVNLRHLLQAMLEDGRKTFADKADFNFIAGYTVSIFPYEYGQYEDMEKMGKEMLRRATQLAPDNLIYRLAYLGSITDVDRQLYRQAEIAAAPDVLATFSGRGALNKYFRGVLYRPDKTA